MKNVYIVLSQTGTIFSRAIRLYTRDQYNHASMSFDSKLLVMYSFGRRKRYNLLDSGFVIENFARGMYLFFPNTRCCVLEVAVTEAEYDAMLRIVKHFCDNQYGYRYNLLGIFAYMAGISFERKNHYFCSQFVSYVLNQTDFWNCNPEFTRPMDFLKIPHKRIVFEGSIQDYMEQYWTPAIPSLGV
ncbi:MAG: hypothetical protein ACOX2G_10895 [Bacillota bacterium]|jgi:hypothetical protein